MVKSSCPPVGPPRLSGVFFFVLLVVMLAGNAWALDVRGGNYGRWGDQNSGHPAPYELVEDTTVYAGNFELCRIVTNGFSLTKLGGNWRGHYLDGEKQDDHIKTIHEPLPKALLILDRARWKMGDQGADAWNWAVDYLVDHELDEPATTKQQLVDAFAIAAAADDPDLPGAPTSAIDISMAFDRLHKKYFDGLSWAQTVAEILAPDDPVKTWRGDSVVLVGGPWE